MKEYTPDDPDFLEGIPTILYKYRNWDIDFHKKILDGEIYFSSFDQLNDPFEGSIPFRYKKEQLTEQNIYKKFTYLIKSKRPNITSKEIELEWQEQLKIRKWDDLENRARLEAEFKTKLNQRTGIFSVCEKKDNYLLWSYYSNAHKGFCVGLDTKKLIVETVSSICKVTYSEIIPQIDVFEGSSTAFHKLTETKAFFWNHENEFRLKNIKLIKASYKVTPPTIREIIFGVKMNEAIKFQIMEQVLKFNNSAKFYNTALNLEEFRLDISEIKSG